MSWAQKQRTEQYTEDEAAAVQQGLEQHERTTQSSANAARVRAPGTSDAGDCRPVTPGLGTAYRSFCDLDRARRVCETLAALPRRYLQKRGTRAVIDCAMHTLRKVLCVLIAPGGSCGRWPTLIG